MDEQKLIEALHEKGYIYNGQVLSNVSSLSQLTSDLLKILSKNFDIIEEIKIPFHKPIELTDEELRQFAFKVAEPFTFIMPDIEARRKIISDTIFPDNKYPTFTNNHLNSLFTYYDYYFFNNMISYALKKSDGQIIFEFSDRMTRTGGTCTRKGICSYLIKISSDRLNQLMPNNINLITVNGLSPKDKVEALQLVFEHELIHAVLSIFTNNVESHSPLFKDMTRNLFGHLKITYGITDSALSNQLSTPTSSFQSRVSNTLTKLSKTDFDIGDTVSFLLHGQRVIGKIIKINPKRALVSTNKGDFRVSYGLLSHA